MGWTAFRVLCCFFQFKEMRGGGGVLQFKLIYRGLQNYLYDVFVCFFLGGAGPNYTCSRIYPQPNTLF